ncbi:hypothetical protein GCM10007301_49980 [Azorhizobium oxalatiphilum]|uniref:Uncharacterized protein n=1 Tax=Azorhizobium oxalatiphilum TaxID=980631 RepID=A0A917CEV6_9HYPH|nr:hypothetical protein [Azorhizobium oxalatiphilum]GGF83991.1 hypothetical protein GCM10007301_49980 [Azorhizobium oxalatiphilum]
MAYDDDTHIQNINNPEANKYCPNNNPLIDFAGYKWWINYHWSQKDGTYFYGDGGSFNSIFDPTIIKADGQTVQLAIRKPSPADPNQVWRTSEIVLVDKLGYGKYLITAVADNGSFANLDPKAVFGAFTYQYSEAPPEQGLNKHREIDGLEVLRGGASNAQFTLQPYDPPPNPVKFFTIPPDVGVLTMYLHWFEENGVPVCHWALYYKDLDLGGISLLGPDQAWQAQGFEHYIPRHTATSCERFHINLWLMFGKNATGLEQSVTVKRFQFEPA